MRSARSLGDLFTFGGRIPATVGALICVIVAASLIGKLAPSSGIVEAAALFPLAVWHGQMWRLVTWVFFEQNPFSLLFGGLTLYWFGRDLCYAWGTGRFIGTFFGLAAGTAAVTCLLARGWPELMGFPFLGAWPVILALTIAWAMIFPERQILFMLALPISGRTLVWITLGGTLLYAVFDRLTPYVPHLTAQLLMVAYGRGWSLRGLWQTLRIRQYERRARRRARHLKIVDKQEPPRWLN